MSLEGIDEAPQPDPARVRRTLPHARVIGFAAALTVWLVLCAFCGPRFQMELYASEPHEHGWWVRDAHVIAGDLALPSPAFCVDVAIECPRHNSEDHARWTYARGHGEGPTGHSGYAAVRADCAATGERLVACEDGCADGYCRDRSSILTCGVPPRLVGPSWVDVDGHTSATALVGGLLLDALSPRQVLGFVLRFALGGPEYARQAAPRIIAGD